MVFIIMITVRKHSRFNGGYIYPCRDLYCYTTQRKATKYTLTNQGVSSQDFFPIPSSSSARNLIYVQARAKPSSEIQIPSEPELSSARISHMLSSLSRAWLGFQICHRAVPSQASSDFLAQAGTSFIKLPTLCHT